MSYKVKYGVLHVLEFEKKFYIGTNYFMLQYINLENYKAFETAKIPLRPITILLGANSVGKSSIIQLMLMLQQTGKAGLRSYKSPLKLYGGYVNLGDAINLFRHRDTSQPLKIGFEIRSPRLRDYLREDLISQFTRSFFELPLYLPIKGLSNIRNKSIKKSEDFELYLNTIMDVLSKEKIQTAYVDQINWMLRTHSFGVNMPTLDKEGRKKLLSTYEFLQVISKTIKNEVFEVNFELRHHEENLQLRLIEIMHTGRTLLKLIIRDDEAVNILSDVVTIEEDDIRQINAFFDGRNTIFNSFNDAEIDRAASSLSILSSILIRIFSFFQNEVKKEFVEESLNYVSPLRAHPKRYYMLDKAKLNLTLDTLDGDAIAEVIKDDSKVKKKVNNWLQKFGIQVNVEGFKEVIHHLKVKQNNLDLDITDVGFGISQVLPVIIQGFLSADNSTTIIEQPEIHLHPKIQADLADLFIDIVNSSGRKKLVIETHSEYILKRLRRRISEGVILPSQVAICLIDPQSSMGGANVNILGIEEKGFFEWPVDFYDGELYNDTVEFLKNQN